MDWCIYSFLFSGNVRRRGLLQWTGSIQESSTVPRWRLHTKASQWYTSQWDIILCPRHHRKNRRYGIFFLKDWTFSIVSFWWAMQIKTLNCKFVKHINFLKKHKQKITVGVVLWFSCRTRTEQTFVHKFEYLYLLSKTHERAWY